jgi:menaquinone-specific isochorismate synthase
MAMSGVAATSRVAVDDASWERATFSQWIATARVADGLVELILEVPSADATALTSVLPRLPRVLWRDRAGQQCIGIGAVVELRASGASRFTDIAKQAQQVKWAEPVSALHAMSRAFVGGFAFAPGAADDEHWRGFGDSWFMLPRWTYVPGLSGAPAMLILRVAGEEIHSASEQATRQAEFVELLRHLRTLADTTKTSRVGVKTVGVAAEITGGSTADKAKWQTLIADIHSEFAAGRADKIVAARSIEIGQRKIDLEAVLARLWSAQRNCYGVALSPGADSATFVAAPPERLIRKRGARVESEALAGTLPSGTPESNVAGLLHDRKNLDEHQWVIDAIAVHLRDAGVQLDAAHSTTVRTFRNVHHLHTAITGTMTARRHILQLVEDLHPTPAVGGTPRESALQWIAAHEAPRGYYASPVGWFNPDGDGEFSVAIRCALINDDGAKLWAGAGIVSASDADIEYGETNAKLQTMLSALAADPGL